MNSGDTITVMQAAQRLGLSLRHTRRLVTSGALVSSGTGTSRRVSVESVRAYGKKKSDIEAGCHSTMSPFPSKSEAMKVLNAIPPLSEPAKAARLLGLAPEALLGLIAAGAVPAIPVGHARFVPAFWLRRVLSQAEGLPISGLKGGR